MKPILEIRSSEPITAEQADMLQSVFSNQFTDYEVIIMDAGMSAHIHDEQILDTLKQILACVQPLADDRKRHHDLIK